MTASTRPVDQHSYRAGGYGSSGASISRATKAAGFWSAVFATVLSITYVVGQLAEWAGWLGSQGGPSSSSTPLGLAVLLTPSFLLGSSFLVLMVSVHELAPAHKRVWSHAAVAFATAYAVLTGTVYFVQLTFVAPHLVRGDTAAIEGFRFVPFDSYLYAVDILGYSFMSVATLFAGLALAGSAARRVARSFLILNGMLVPFLALQMYFHSLIWIASAWAVTFPASTWALALIFWRAEATDATSTVA
jgi:hypothetical protein